jgi:hypothetical protein
MLIFVVSPCWDNTSFRATANSHPINTIQKPSNHTAHHGRQPRRQTEQRPPSLRIIQKKNTKTKEQNAPNITNNNQK